VRWQLDSFRNSEDSPAKRRASVLLPPTSPTKALAGTTPEP
jgi:hypothetical protein